MDTLIKSGRIKPSHALEIAESKIGLGFEKLDRDVVDLPIIGRPGPSPRIHQDESPWGLITGGFQKPNGSSAFVFWKPAPLLTTTFEAPRRGRWRASEAFRASSTCSTAPSTTSRRRACATRATDATRSSTCPSRTTPC